MITCPDCGAEMVLRRSYKFKYANGTPRPFYGCSRYPECRAAHGAHPDGRPLGTPANAETKKARIAAHAVFDQLWTAGGKLTRKEAYQRVAQVLGVEEIHIGECDTFACARVIDAVKAIQAGLVCLILLFALPAPVFPQALTFKNDFFAPGGRDRWLTNDVRLSYQQWAVGQEMYTPTNKRAAEIPQGDRPWDGYTYLERQFAVDSERTVTARAGALGSASKAKRLQKYIHNDLSFGSDPQGWDTANPSEPAIDVEYEHRTLSAIDSWVGVTEQAQSYGARAGNVRCSLWLDQEVQKGFNLDGWKLRTLAGLRGEMIGYNTFLDGRAFHHDRYTAERQPFVASARAGFEIRRGAWFLRYTYSYMTEEFEGQDGRHLFGTIELGRS